jgi:hypothetical protein
MSNKIKILDASLTELAVISAAGSALRTERINAENTLSFTARIKSGYGAYITDTSVFELSGDYFDVAFYKKEQQGDGSLIVSVEAEHVSYRLNEPDYDLEYYTEEAAPAAILAVILSGTGFTVGTVDFAAVTAFSLQEATSRRSLLMQFAAYLGGELEFNGFSVSILTQRGSSTPKTLRVGKDITVISKAVDKRRLDASGNPTVSYACGVYKGASLVLGDVVTLDYEALDIDTTLRVVGISYDPYNPNRVSVEIGNYINSLEDDLYRIETRTVTKDKVYNGIRIGPTYGFEAVRSDKKARAYFRSDEMKAQVGDGSGTTWIDKLYYAADPDTGLTELYFNGKFTAEVIEALSAIITPNLYAGKATISELTVDQLDTSDKVKKYLTSDTTPDNFQRIYDQYHELVTASTDGLEANKVQAVNRDGDMLYWTDETHTAATTDETAYPVYTFNYTEQVKWKVFFYEHGTGIYVPAMKWGAGAPNDENLDSCLMYKLEGEFWIVMTNADGTQIKTKWAGQNLVLEGNTGSFGVRNIGIGAELPTTGQEGDLYILVDEGTE